MPKIHALHYDGMTHSLKEWSDTSGINYQTLRSRIYKGWPLAKALTTPALPKGTCNVTHGKSGSKEYKAWLAMKCRCSDSRRHNAHRYVGRGIRVCPQWEHNFDAFYRHVGPAPSPYHSLGRIDNDRGYEPGNVRWETASEQARNRGTSCKQSPR